MLDEIIEYVMRRNLERENAMLYNTGLNAIFDDMGLNIR